MLSKDFDCLMFGTKSIFLHSVHQHLVFGGVGLSKRGYRKMPPKRAYVLVLGIFEKVHCMTCTKRINLDGIFPSVFR